jgi:hypothetical protein
MRLFTAGLIGLAIVGVVLHELTPGRLADLAAEDGPLENVQAATLLIAAGTCGWGLVRRNASTWAWPLGLGCLLLFGEEISWGQRLLGFTGPATVAAHNRQREFNVHNLTGVNELIRDVGVVVLLVVFLAVPMLIRRRKTTARITSRIGFVAPNAVCATSALIAITYWRIPRWLGRNDFGFDEFGELFLAVTVLAYAGQVATQRSRRLRAAAAGPPPSPPATADGRAPRQRSAPEQAALPAP